MRLFIAIELNAEIKEGLERVAEELHTDGVAVQGNDALHVTLQFLGEKDSVELDAIREALLRVKFKSFKISVEGVDFFSPGFMRVVFAKVSTGADDVIVLYNRICRELNASGIRFDVAHEYTPHITLARVKRARNVHRLMSIVKKHSTERFGELDVHEFVLKASTLTENGAVHKALLHFSSADA